MKKLKGITPIIAILVMLLITIAITGSAWIYVSTYYSGMTGKAI
jgi:flagellin-like protein